MLGVRIKSFGNNGFAKTPEELAELLQSKYSGKHVTLVSETPNGFSKITFVSIKNGGVINTYSGEKIDVKAFFSSERV